MLLSSFATVDLPRGRRSSDFHTITMKLKSLLLVTLAAGAAISQSQAALVAYWNFNALSISTASVPGTGGVPTSIPADSGSGTLSLANWTGLVDDFAGTTINALNSDLAGATLSPVSDTGNGSHVDLIVSTTGVTDIKITFATRGTSTGFTIGLWSYSTDGGTSFTAAGLPNTATASTTFALATADFSGITAVENASNVIFRYTLDGATGASGNNRIDNIQINAIPEPAAALLGALGGLVLLRRRR
jgi:hypothetical protein